MIIREKVCSSVKHLCDNPDSRIEPNVFYASKCRKDASISRFTRPRTEKIRECMPDRERSVRQPGTGTAKTHHGMWDYAGDYTPCIYMSGNRKVRCLEIQRQRSGVPTSSHSRTERSLCGATDIQRQLGLRTPPTTRYHPQDQSHEDREESRSGQGRGGREGKGKTETVRWMRSSGWRHAGTQESAIARARGAPRYSRRADMLPQGNGGECARGVRTVHGRFTIAVARDRCEDPLPTVGERRLREPSAARYAATRDDDDDGFTGDEESGEQWRRVENALPARRRRTDAPHRARGWRGSPRGALCAGA